MLISRRNADLPDKYLEHTREIYEKFCAAINPILDETTVEVFMNVFSSAFVIYLVTTYAEDLYELQEDAEDILDVMRKNIEIQILNQFVRNLFERPNAEG